MIREVDSIPKLDTKRVKGPNTDHQRGLVRADMQEAVEKGIFCFELVGEEYDFDRLDVVARDAIEEYLADILVELWKPYKESLMAEFGYLDNYSKWSKSSAKSSARSLFKVKKRESSVYVEHEISDENLKEYISSRYNRAKSDLEKYGRRRR